MKIKNLSRIFKAMSDETRLKILYMLYNKPLCVCEMMGALGITQTKTSRHLIYLKNAGLLDSQKEDRWVVYKIRTDLPSEIERLIERVITIMKYSGELDDVEKRLQLILSSESTYRQVYGIDHKDHAFPSSRTQCQM